MKFSRVNPLAKKNLKKWSSLVTIMLKSAFKIIIFFMFPICDENITIISLKKNVNEMCTTQINLFVKTNQLPKVRYLFLVYYFVSKKMHWMKTSKCRSINLYTYPSQKESFLFQDLLIEFALFFYFFFSRKSKRNYDGILFQNFQKISAHDYDQTSF